MRLNQNCNGFPWSIQFDNTTPHDFNNRSYRHRTPSQPKYQYWLVLILQYLSGTFNIGKLTLNPSLDDNINNYPGRFTCIAQKMQMKRTLQRKNMT